MTLWVKRNIKLSQGIRYSSTKIIQPPFKGDFYNLVLPPIEIKDEGYCSELKRYFSMSPVCSGSIHKLQYENYFLTQYTPSVLINANVEIVEWNRNVLEYHETDIGKMEFYLKNNLPSAAIKF